MSQCIPWGLPYVFDVALLDRTTGQHRDNPTLAAGDFKISKDGAAFANPGTTPSVVPAATQQVQVTLSASETECSRVTVYARDVAGAEWDDDMFTFHTPAATGAICGKITSGTPTTTTFVSSQLVGTNASQYVDAWVTFLSGTCAGATKRITGFVPGTDTLTFDALPAAPAVGDVFIVVNGA